MKKTVLLLCLLLAGCGGAQQQHLADIKWAFQFREMVEHVKSDTGSFSMDLVDMPPSQSSCGKGSLPYQMIVCSPNLSNVPTNREYVLYCPNTGCAVQPEVYIPFFFDDEKMIHLSSRIIKANINIPSDQMYIGVYANPSFCADWYLLSCDFSQRFHTTFIYQPNICSLSNGKTLQITKREPLGNVLEIFLSGFEPYEQVLIESNSEEEIRSFCRTADERGAFSFLEFPQVVGKTKGLVTITVTTKDMEKLSSATDWNMASLEIEREQQLTYLRRISLDKVCPFMAKEPGKNTCSSVNENKCAECCKPGL